MEASGRDLVITGGRVYTADRRHPWAEAMLIKGDHITYVGSKAEALAHAPHQAERLHLPDTLVVPGLNDSHIHTNYGGYALQMLDLDGVRTQDELQDKLRAYAEAHPEKEWIEGTSLSYDPLLHAEAPRLAIDAVVADRPVYLRAFDWHSAWANTRALELAGIERGADIPLPNEVVVDARGYATGLMRERLAFNKVQDLIPKRSSDQEDACLVDAMRYLNRMGITSVQNMHGDPETLQRYLRLHERGEQTVRAYHTMRTRPEELLARLPEFAELARRQRDSFNRVPAIKLFIDGVVEGKTAMMLEPYADGSGDVGVPDLDLGLYDELVCAADALGLQVVTHAIGDRGIRCALDAYEHAARANGTTGRRHRVEHVETGHADDLPRFSELGVVASMQPLHCAPTYDPSTSPYTALLGPERVQHVFPWQSLLQTGAVLAFGSDWPVVSPDVMKGLHVALTRTSLARLPVEGYSPHERVTLAQALNAYTRAAAYAEFQEAEKGMLRAGMLADVTVFSRDLFRYGADAVLDTEIVLTVLGGTVVYRNPSAAR